MNIDGKPSRSRDGAVTAYNDALLALGQYVFENSAFIRCDHPSTAICAEVNERLTGLVDAVDSFVFGGDDDPA